MGSEGYKADYSGKSSGISSTAARHPSGFGYIKAQKNQYKLITE